ncbi:MAG: hypothetical protein SOR11_02295 [Fusobacterium sp.]|uniref:hypothetical protein n=1 Tax=Fusobacterium sp. TaxID=68766 RepID=UPI002942211D|nr:hypothetical protein [Fusobacterium sp.]MDY3058821.1 hypothetical protein [Fusobacterium sp.]
MKKLVFILSFIFLFSNNIFAKNEELIEGGIVKYDHHTHIVGIYKTPQEATNIFNDRSKHFSSTYKKIKNVLFYCQDQRTEINIFVKKNREDMYCFVMIEGNKVIYASEIPEDDCSIVKKFLK